MKIKFAPMEGLTTYVYRNAHNKYFGGIDTYFSPFISVHKDKKLNFKEKNDILPSNNEGINLVPQVMASDVDEFIFTSSQIKDMGYDHINLNFGCPSGTVTTKGKGAGALIYPEKLEAFLDGVFSKTDFKFSVKTRIGYSDTDEFYRLLKIYEKFPLEELIIHGRVREEFYNGKSRIDFVAKSVKDVSKKIKISYNGDITNLVDYENFKSLMPDAYGCMIGRGILSNPALGIVIKNANSDLVKDTIFEHNPSEAVINNSSGVKAEDFIDFNLEILEGYERIMSGDKNCLFRLKELWFYMSSIFKDQKKMLKTVQKLKSIKEYELVIKSIKAEDIA